MYGSVFKLRLGSTDCVVVNSDEEIREVLITKGDHFDGRPDWRRFDLMFGGSRRNGKILRVGIFENFNFFFVALAFCDFDKLQVIRRRLLRSHTFPNAGGDMWAKLDKVTLEYHGVSSDREF